MTEREQICKEFTEFNGGHWHEIAFPECGINNPTYPDAKSILEVMDTRDDGEIFYANLIYSGNIEANDDDGYIPRFYILDSDKLLIAAWNWCRENPLEVM
jgi:hypothetical protein